MGKSGKNNNYSIHYVDSSLTYKFELGIEKTLCEIERLKTNDYSSVVKYVTCNKCLKKMNEIENFL